MFLPLLATVTDSITVDETITVSLALDAIPKLDDPSFTQLDLTVVASEYVDYFECVAVQVELDMTTYVSPIQEEAVVDLFIKTGDFRPATGLGYRVGSGCGDVSEWYPFPTDTVSSVGSGSGLVLDLTATVTDTVTHNETVTVTLSILDSQLVIQ